jgi:hypothetical protein
MLRKTKRVGKATSGARRKRRVKRGAAYVAKRRTTRRRNKTYHAKTVKGPSVIVLATVPPRPKGYLTYQKGTKLIAKKMNRKGYIKKKRGCRV